MDQVESSIRRVLQDHHKISSSVRSEEAKIDALNKDIKALDDRIREAAAAAASSGDGSAELERLRLRNLLSYQSTLIARAASRTELLRALNEDLLALFLRRKQLRQCDGSIGSGVDVVPNISLSSGLSSGDDDNQGFPSNGSRSLNNIKTSDNNDNLEEVTTEQVQLPLGLKMLQINMNEDACLTPEDGSEYGDPQFKNNILDKIAMSILDPNSNVDNIFNETVESSNFARDETQGSKKLAKKLGRATQRNLARHLTVDFDELGNPTGPNAGAFKRSINSYVCHCLPVRFKQIGDVPVEDYKLVLNVLTERYNFDLNRSYIRKKISSCYRQHKYKLLVQVKKDLERGIEPQKPSYVKKEDWDAFVAKTKDEDFDRISKKNKASRRLQNALNRKGFSPTSIQKRKLNGSEQSLVNETIWLKVQKPKRGRPRKLLGAVGDIQNVVDGMDIHVSQEGFISEKMGKSCLHLDSSNHYGYWNPT